MFKGKKRRINNLFLREDLRKIGLAFIAAGCIGLIAADFDDTFHAVLLMFIGIASWIVGLIEETSHAGN